MSQYVHCGPNFRHPSLHSQYDLDCPIDFVRVNVSDQLGISGDSLLDRGGIRKHLWRLRMTCEYESRPEGLHLGSIATGRPFVEGVVDFTPLGQVHGLELEATAEINVRDLLLRQGCCAGCHDHHDVSGCGLGSQSESEDCA